MKSRFLKYFFMFGFLLTLPFSGMSQKVELKNGFFYIDGKKFFVKGIGYEVGAAPDEVPYNHTFDPDQIRFDMHRIQSAGFNTIRTWAALTNDELQVMQSYNIKIIMGIWIDPNGNFSDPSFVSQAESKVANTISYSKNYSNIIAYLIMNEPLANTIFNSGYDNTVQLWKDLINIIHTEDPNKPVSISNSSNGTYINPDIFDFNAYNAYIYNPVTVNYLDGYQDYISYLKNLGPQEPLIITEFGLSVSPSGPGNWGYGGNTLAEQASGDLHMYQSLVNGGASGACIFNYSDGWWKAGDEYVHNDNPEEWFGLVGYSSVTDHQGETRPAWNAISNYQSAIITQPKTGEIYSNKVPVEIFPNDTVKKIKIYSDTTFLAQISPTGGYVTDTLNFQVQDKKDVILRFYCLDAENHLLKEETRNILVAHTPVTLPKIEITTNNDYWQTGTVDVTYKIIKSNDFNTDSSLDYAFYPHVRWNYGQAFQTKMPAGDTCSFSTQHSLTSDVNAFTVGAAFNIAYNGFKKRIVKQLTVSKASVLSAVSEKKSSHIEVYPNPVSNFIRVSFDQPLQSSHFEYEIFSSTGTLIIRAKEDFNQQINVENLTPGIYFIRIITNNQKVSGCQKIIVSK